MEGAQETGGKRKQQIESTLCLSVEGSREMGWYLEEEVGLNGERGHQLRVGMERRRDEIPTEPPLSHCGEERMQPTEVSSIVVLGQTFYLEKGIA